MERVKTWNEEPNITANNSQTSALPHAISHNVNIFHMTIWGKDLKNTLNIDMVQNAFLQMFLN
jgi:hypothetical protein